VRFIPPDDLSSVWGFVEPGLNEVLALTKEPWTVTHVKDFLRNGAASLFVDEDGFVVLQRLKAAWTSDPYLNVWVMWLKPDTGRPRIEELFAWLDGIKEQTKCDWWEWSSPREGWRWLERLGLTEKVRTVWRRK
jgi:hypothetical protein